MLTGYAANLGVFPWVYGDSRNAPASNEDIARVAVAALMDPARHAGKRHHPIGPELLDARDMAQAIGRAVGRAVKALPTPAWLFMKSARLGGLPIDLIGGLRYCIDDHKRGAFELGEPKTDVLDVTGRPPEDFETIARRYAALPGNQRTPGNRFRQFAQFMMAALRSGFNLDQCDRECAGRSRRDRSLYLRRRSGGASTTSLTSRTSAHWSHAPFWYAADPRRRARRESCASGLAQSFNYPRPIHQPPMKAGWMS